MTARPPLSATPLAPATVLAVTVTLLVSAAGVAGDEPAAHGWRLGAELGAIGVAGNTESAALAAGIEASRDGPVWSWIADGELHVHRVERSDAEDDHERWEDLQLRSDLRRALGQRRYALLRLKTDHRPRSGIDHDAQLGGGLGLQLVSSDGGHTTRLEAGVSGVSEKQAGDRSFDYVGGFLRSELTWTLPEGSTLTWDGDVKLGTGEGSDLKSEQELELEAPLSRRVSLKVALEWRYDAEPPAGYAHDDLKLAVTLALRSPPSG